MAFNRRQVQRLFYTAVTGIFLLLLIWTGSRGGMGMFLIGATAVLYRRFGQTVLLLPLVAIALVVMLKVAEAANIKLGAERLMDTTNTRAAPWSSLLKSGLSSPIFGVGPESVEGSENSYLLAFASYGFGMVILMFLLVGISALQCLRLYRVRRSVDPATGSLIDLVLGQQAIYFLGSVFEGYVNARVGSNLVILLIFAAIGKYLLAYTSGRAAVEGGDAVEYAPIQEGDASPSLVGAA
jgi:hypothetical protein